MSQLGANFFVIDNSQVTKHSDEHELGSIPGQGRARRSLDELQQSSQDYQMQVDERKGPGTVFDLKN